MQFIDLNTQYKRIETQIQDSIQKVLNHGQYIMGPEIQLLEKALAEFIGVKHAIVNSSGTDALLMALLALDIAPGDEVITTPFSFFATAEVILLCHAKPVFVDIDPKTYNMDPAQLEAAITPRTKAIMPVSLYGQVAEMDEINRIAKRYGLPVIEDAAQSFGAQYKGRHSCNVSTIACTSFFPSKPLGAYGDAGACFTDDDILAQRLVEIRNHGQNIRYHHRRIGLNGRMDTMQAAILLEKLKIFPEEIALRQSVASRYNELLKGIAQTPTILSHNISAYAQYTIEVSDREQFITYMTEQGIPTAVHYPIALHHQKIFENYDYSYSHFPHAENASQRVVSLPMHPYLTEEEQKRVVSAVEKSLQKLSVEV